MTAVQDRQAWLQERRAAVEAQYDDESPEFDAQPYPAISHPDFVRTARRKLPG